MYQPDDFDTQIQCEEYFREEYQDIDEDGNYRRHSKQSHLSGEEISKLRSRNLREAKKKARSRKRMLRERFRSEKLSGRNTSIRKREGSSVPEANREAE